MNRPAALKIATATALVAGHMLAHADVIEIDWGTDLRFERSVPVAPGKFAEVCGKLPKGTAVTWSFEASGPLDFNVHYHLGKKVVFPTKLAAVTRANDRLEAGIEQDYCWMWSNKSTSSTTLTVRLQR